MPVLPLIDGLTATVFLALAAVFMLDRRQPHRMWQSAGMILTALWAIAFAWPALQPSGLPGGAWTDLPAAALDVGRFAAWYLALLLLIDPRRLPDRAGLGRRITIAGALAVAAVVVLLDISPVIGVHPADDTLWASAGLIGHLAFAVTGLMIVENVWRNARGDRIWSVKFLLLAVGSICAFDFYLYADALLFNRLDADLFAARPLVALTTAPLIGLAMRRRPVMTTGLAPSRDFVFRSVALLGSGLYLLIMGAAGLYIRDFGGSWSLAVQTAFLVGAAALLVSILASGSFRARAKLLIARHLFAAKYDYRQEWLRFIATLAEDEESDRLPLRVVKAIAQIVESPGGSLWLLDDDGQRFTCAENWNDRPADGVEPATGGLSEFLARTQQVLDLDDLVKRPAAYPAIPRPEWLMAARAPWLVVPLVHRERLLGFTLLQHSRAPRQLDDEDRDLLGPIGRQAASVLAEHRAQRALDDAREIDLFNRRFAFVVHDVKTITSQMSLLLANADKHGRNPAFQSDLIASIRDSVRSMRRLLGQINAERDRSARPGSLDLVPLVGRLVEQRVGDGRIRFDCSLSRLHVNADEGSMTAVVGHLLQNAVEAATHLVHVKLAGAADGTRAVIEVEDDGPGMDADFVRDRLFRPLVSTKAGGFGIGAYQCRELTRELGGWLTVSSTPGKGTTMRATFPLAELAHIHPTRAALSS